MSNTAYQAMKTAAETIGWPTSHPDDLYKHDRERLEGDDVPKRFGWVLRELGTEILDTRMQRESLQGYLKHYRAGTSPNHWHVWDGSELREVTYENFRAIMEEWNEEDADAPSERSTHNTY